MKWQWIYDRNSLQMILIWVYYKNEWKLKKKIENKSSEINTCVIDRKRLLYII